LKVMKRMKDSSVDLIVTDPPYGINYCSNNQTSTTHSRSTEARVDKSYFKKIKGDSLLPTKWISQAYRVLKEGGACYIYCRWDKWGELLEAVKRVGFKLKNMIVLKKSGRGMGDLKGQYAPQHELILFCTKGRHELVFPIKRITDVWDVKVLFSARKRFHPNQKHESMIQPIIENSSYKGDIVLDPFFGSGTTGVVCKRLDRKFIGIEVDREYWKIAVKRVLGKEVT